MSLSPKNRSTCSPCSEEHLHPVYKEIGSNKNKGKRDRGTIRKIKLQRAIYINTGTTEGVP